MSAPYGPYLIGGAGSHLETLRRLQPRVANFLDPNADDVRAFKVVCPHTKIVGRIYRPDGEIEERIRANPEAAAQWAHELANANSAVAAGLIDWVAVANEVCQFWDTLPLLSRFELRRMQLEEQAGRGAGIGAFSVGQPDLPVADRLALWRQVYPMLAYADRSQHRHVLLIHQYGAPDLYGPQEKGGAPWLINRFEIQVLPNLPYKDLGIVVQEYGVDGLLLNDLGRAVRDAEQTYGTGVLTPSRDTYTAPGLRASGSPPRGWSIFTSAPEHVQALIKMGQWLEQFRDRMLGYCLFCVGQSAPWQSYDHAGPVLEGLADYYSRQPEPPVVVPPATSPLAQRLQAAFGAQFSDLRASLPHHATLKYQRRALSAVQQTLLHHTATAQSTAWQTVAKYHVDSNGWPGIAYHVGIHADGRVALLNDLEAISYHAGAANDNSAAICVVGDYETDAVTPALWQRILAVKAVLDAHLGRSIPLLGHRDAVGSVTVCPGKNLYAKLKAPTLEEPPMDTDPRAANCRKFAVDSRNEIVGIELVVRRSPSAMYELYRAELLDPYHSGGNAVVKCVALDENNVEVSERIVKGWPWPTLDAGDSPALAGNPNNEWEITSKFDAAKGVIGPLAFYILGPDNRIISDIVAGYGQATGYGHIGGRVTFRARGAVVVVPPVEPPVVPPVIQPTGNLAEDVRNLASNNIMVGMANGVPYNPTLAFPKEARRLKLGGFLTLELRQLAGYVVQGFALGILYCKDGDWGHIERVEW